MPDLASAAREAYLSGWSLRQDSLTEHAIAGCEAAVSLVLERPHDPGILELSLDLGKLTGTWRTVYDRREDLTRDHIAKVMAVWRKMIHRLGVRDLVARYRRDSAIFNPVEATDPRKKWRQDEARAAALGWLYKILSDPAYEDLAKTMAVAMAAAEAEGKTAALAVAADMAQADGFSWDAAYKAMYAGLNDLGQLPGMADQWIQNILGASATDVGRILVRLGEDGASEADMIQAVMDAVGGEDVQAVSLLVDQAIGASMMKAAISLYAQEGAQQLAFLSAGDSRVCMACEAYEAQGPYSPAQFPDIPVHPRCRCCSAPVDNLPISAFADFLVPTS